MRFLPIILGLLLLACSCGSSGCLENRNSVPLAGFYASGTDDAIRLDSVEVSGLDMSAPLYKAGENLSSVYLPMRSTQQSTSWIFAYKWKDLDFEELNDTLTFHYSSLPFFASADCGVIYKYHISEVAFTSHLIDSVVLVDSIITNIDVEQIKIFFKTQQTDEPDETDSL